ncbi:S9 family peptidase, partial [bacterium AH-315-P15]|nr:S9 family peptidase [bacterium AH-315-P15]
MAHVFPRLLAGLIIFSAALFSLSAQAQTPPPAEAFLWEMGDLELSPDGRYLSMIQPYEGRSALVIYPLGGGEPTLIEPGERGYDENIEVSNHFWATNDRIVVVVNWNDQYISRYSNFRLEQTRILSIRPDGSDPQVLFETRQDEQSDADRQSGIIDVLEDDDDHVLVALRDCGRAVCVGTVHKVNILTGRSVIVARGSDDTARWATNSNGDVIARTDYVSGQIRLMVREPGSLDWRTIQTRQWFDEDGEGELTPITALNGGRTLYVRSNHEGRDGIYSIDLAGGGGMERVFLHDWVDVGGLNYSAEDDALTSVAYTVHTPRMEYFDEEEEADVRRYARMLLGGSGEPSEDDRAIGNTVYVISETEDENIRVLMTMGPGDPPVFYLMNDDTHSISEIGQYHPQLSPDNLANISVVTYQARDGLEIPGYLALPPGTTLEDGPFPFVLYPHGGPNARDTADFDTLRQFLATRGYAVFAPQFRGSRGFGNEFLRAGFEEWGDAMQDDLTDATQHMIDIGIAQPEHMCIVGWSYSAYAALMAAVKTPDLYNCAVGINGVYDLPRMMGDLRTSRAYTALEFWAGSMGDETSELARVSPNRRVDEIRIPVLVIASMEDQTVPYEETTRIIRSLRQANRQFD